MLTRLHVRHAWKCYGSGRFATFSTTTDGFGSASTTGTTTTTAATTSTTDGVGSTATVDTTTSTTISSPAEESTHETWDHLGDYSTGKVKFFDRNKLFGFVIPDNEPKTEVYLHRIDFVTPLPFEESPKSPALFSGDHIRFRIQPFPNGKKRARQITSSDGEPLPPLRKSFLKYRLRYAFTQMGMVIHAAIQNPDLTQDQQWQAVQQAYTDFQEREAGYHQIIENVGMKVEDFYTEEVNELNDTDATSTAPYASEEQMGQDILSESEDGAAK